jgi:predicted ribosome quality control (RQC) complex YloA/Tae2 family protein
MHILQKLEERLQSYESSTRSTLSDQRALEAKVQQLQQQLHTAAQTAKRVTLLEDELATSEKVAVDLQAALDSSEQA